MSYRSLITFLLFLVNWSITLWKQITLLSVRDRLLYLIRESVSIQHLNSNLVDLQKNQDELLKNWQLCQLFLPNSKKMLAKKEAFYTWSIKFCQSMIGENLLNLPAFTGGHLKSISKVLSWCISDSIIKTRLKTARKIGGLPSCQKTFTDILRVYVLCACVWNCRCQVKTLMETSPPQAVGRPPERGLRVQLPSGRDSRQST